MNVLILGSGGREHAFAWKIKQSPLCKKLFIAPGNPGSAALGVNVSLALHNFSSIATFCLEQDIQIIVVGPEDSLVNGIYDFFQQIHLQHIQVIGPSQLGAQLEGSKAFAKQFMMRHQIPTAAYREFTINNFSEGLAYIQQHRLPIVLKADGLAAGKGVVIATSHQEAIDTFTEMIELKKFGEASSKVVIEEFLSGIECSVFVLSNGQQYVILPTAKDYKRIGEGDQGLNTGGMGAISPVPFVDDEFMQKIISTIIEPSIKGLADEKIVYEGFIFIGLIKVDNEPFVIEYNCRMGDPETEVVLPRLENDLLDLFIRMKQNTLSEIEIKHSLKHAATLVLVSGGYPEAFEKGKKIILNHSTNSLLFHAGTRLINNELVTNGGRVMAVTSLANNLSDAIAQSKLCAKQIVYEGKYYRNDIGFEFLK
jgi:phosphoribosylamine---glycine ligase